MEEQINRPYSYTRQPFRLTGGEIIGMSGVYFSQPAFAALTDQRLFTDSNSSVSSPFRILINKDTNSFISIEPTSTASGYQAGCVNYSDYIIDVRDLLDDVFNLHAFDSEYTSDDFLRSHLSRRRAPYGSLDSTSGSGTSDSQYVRSAAEISAIGLRDIDIDEISYQPIARPTSRDDLGGASLPLRVRPFFPAVIKPNGEAVSFGPKDASVLDQAGYGIMNSGSEMLVTGDVLVEGTRLRVYNSGLGVAPIAETNFLQHADSTYPGTSGLVKYIDHPSPASGYFRVNGRQSIYGIPSINSEGVYLTSISDDASDPSGLNIQFWPSDWSNTSGVVAATLWTHIGLFVEDRGIYNLGIANPGSLVTIKSLTNGRNMFGHFVGSEADDEGRGMTIGDAGFIHDGKIYSHIGNVSRRLIRYGSEGRSYVQSVERFAVCDNTMSPVSFIDGRVDDQKHDMQFIRAWQAARLENGAQFGVVLFYSPNFGYVDIIVATNSPTSTGGHRFDVITFESRYYFNNGYDSDGNIVWEEDEDLSPSFATREILYYPNSYHLRYPTFSLSNFGAIRAVNIDGDFHVQIRERFTSRYGLITKPTNFQDRLFPDPIRTVSTYVVGFFPSWAIRRVVTTADKQIVLPTTVDTPVGTIEVAPGFTEFTRATLQLIGPPFWDEVSNTNYVYVRDSSGQNWFCKMNSSYQIYEAVKVDPEDAILTGQAGIMEL